MKKIAFFFVCSALAMSSLVGCNSNAGKTEDNQIQADSTASAPVSSDTTSQGGTSQQEGKEHTSAFICPMKCEGSGSSEAGKCPKCGMDYVKNEKQGS